MTQIELYVNGAQAKVKVNGPLTGGMVGVKVSIRYDSAWDGLVKTLVCRSGVENRCSDETRTVLNVGTEAVVAHEVMIAGRTLYLGVEGRSADGNMVFPTVWADCGRIQSGAQATGDPTTARTPEAWEQMLAKMGSLDQLNTVRKETLVAAINEAMTKGNGLPGRGIASLVGNKDGSWTITYDDGNVETVSNDAYIALAEKMEKVFLDMADKEQLGPVFANSIAECTDTSKLYVLPDGYIYAYLSSSLFIQIETIQGGYYNANGAWVEDSQATGQRTNLIPVSEGDQFEVTSAAKYQASVIWFDSFENKLSHETYGGSGKDPVTATVEAPSGAAYARFYSYGWGATYLSVKPLQETYAWASTGHAFVPADYEDRIVTLEEKVDDLGNYIADPLYGKKIVYDGDSICYGAGHKGGYGKIIAELTGGTYENQAVGGGRLVTKGNNNWHSVVDNLPNLPEDGDIYCFEGGINDYWTNGMQLGSFDYSNFDGALDTTTVCGALEAIFRYALNTFVGKPICFVIAHKIQETAYKLNASSNTFKEYQDAMVGICQKYSIPYYDAFTESGLNGWNVVHNENFFTDGDGCHPTEEGYKRYYVPQLLELFRKIIPQAGATTILYYDAIRRYLDENLTAESWTFELEDGSSVSKDVMVK